MAKNREKEFAANDKVCSVYIFRPPLSRVKDYAQMGVFKSE